jgi:hypothetical protein
MAMKTYTIGRVPGNQIVLNDTFVSRQHAQLVITDDGRAIIKDLGSTNGSYVNGNKISECVLKPGDIVKIGSAFLNWSQYLPGKTMTSPPTVFKEVKEAMEDTTIINQEPYVPEEIQPAFSLGKVLKWIAVKVFDTGELFKTEWNKTTSLLFFILLPFGLFCVFFIYSFFQMQNSFSFQSNFGYQVLLPLVMCIFIYGVSQFLTIGLFSIAKRVAFNKILLASSVFSFLQAIPVIIMLCVTAIGMGSYNKMFHTLDNNAAYIFLIIIAVTVSILILLTILIFIYKYFRAIGLSNGVSIHFVVLTLAVNFILQISFAWIFTLIVKQSLLNNVF